MLFAVFDLGSNSFKLSVAQYMGENARVPFKILHKERHAVQFGSSVFDKQLISDRHRVLGLKALKRMHQNLARFPVPLTRIVGTSALRDAKNGNAFVAEVKKKLGLDIQVIKGVEEARIIAQGLEWEYPFVDKGLLVDIGGGSTEVAMFGSGWPELSERSYNLGSVRLALEWEKKRGQKSVEKRLRGLAQEALKGKRAPEGFEYLVGSAGSIQSLSRILSAKKKNSVILKKKLDAWIANSIHKTSAELQGQHSLAASRARVVVPGGIILSEVLNWLGEDEIYVTDMSLRNGLLVDFVEKLKEQGWLIAGR